MSQKKSIRISYAGPSLLETPLLNKGTAFSESERLSFNLIGLLPPRYETIEEQLERAYKQYSSFTQPINKHIYLRAVQDNNETLFYRLVSEHLVEMLPIIYTPTVGDACEHFSDIYRSARGLIVSYEDQHHIDDILCSVTKSQVKVVVITDGERVLGLGDQGIGGMGIAIGKLSLYTACGGISPAYTLPITLDVGTNNQTLLDDPFYMGARHRRIAKKDYNQFVDDFIDKLARRWPGVLIQFEDFAQPNAMPILNRLRNRVCCFNDDIQGTAAVTLGTLLSACKRNDLTLKDQKIIFVGAGSAGCGIAELIIRAMIDQGLTDAEAREQIFMVDRHGLLTQDSTDLLDFQQELVQSSANIKDWNIASGHKSPTLLEVVSNSGANILIGVSGKSGLFTEDVVRQMCAGNSNPIIMPLSNPSRQVEAEPADVIAWSDGKALVATGSPFAPVTHNGVVHEISQCNNSYIFPGIGLGVIASKANRVSDRMLMTASTTLAEFTAAECSSTTAILPSLSLLPKISRKIAFEVAKVAQEQGIARSSSDEELDASIDRNFWTPSYRTYRRIAN